MPALQFNEELHKYYLGGKELPSVTSILTAEKFVDDTWFNSGAALRGTHVHKMTEYYDKGILDINTVDASYLGYLDAYKKFLSEFEPEWILIEHKLYCDRWLYAGTLDRFGFLKNIPKESIVDIKTGGQYDWVSLQTAAYLSALKNTDSLLKSNRYGLYLFENGNYKLIKYEDYRDIYIFRNALENLRWKVKHRIIKGFDNIIYR